MEPVEFREMELILAVSEERSFTRAAERCYISQPALSKVVRKAERGLGAAIFDRGSSPLRVTPEGERILEFFRRFEDVQKELEAYCGSLRSRKKIDLTIGAPSFFCTYVLPSVAAAWQLEHPDSSVRLIETNEIELRSLLCAGMLDLGLTVERSVLPGLQSFVLREEQIVLAVPQGCAVNERLKDFALDEDSLRGGLADDAPKVSVREFERENFLFLKKGNDSRERGLKICRDAGFEPHIAMELDQLLTAYHLAEAGLGVTFVRASLPCFEGLSPRLRFYAPDHPDTRRRIYAVFPERERSPRRREFLDFLRAYPFP